MNVPAYLVSCLQSWLVMIIHRKRKSVLRNKRNFQFCSEWKAVTILHSLFLVAFCWRHDLALKNSFLNSLSQCVNSTLFRMGEYNEKFMVRSLKKLESSLKLEQTKHLKACRGQQHAHESHSWHYLLLPQLKWITDTGVGWKVVRWGENLWQKSTRILEIVFLRDCCHSACTPFLMILHVILVLLVLMHISPFVTTWSSNVDVYVLSREF